MKINLMSSIWLRAKRSTAAFVADCRAVAAVELAVIAPVMLLMFFATVEFSTGVAIDRKVTLVAHTLVRPDVPLDLRHRYRTDQFLHRRDRDDVSVSGNPISSTISELYDRTRHPCREGAVELGSGAACGEVHDDHTCRAARSSDSI